MVHDVPLLQDLLFLLLVSVPIAYLCHRLRLPTIVGFMVVGVAFGPHGIAAVREVDAVNALAEIGVALLLFVIGLEFSLQRLLTMKRLLFLGGGLQVILTGTVAAVFLILLGRDIKVGVFAGFLLALSSTALVLRGYQERSEMDAPHGRVALGILLFQDLCIVPMMILIPVLAGTGAVSGLGVVLALGKAVVALVVVVLAARLVVPFLLRYVVQLRSSEVFILSTALVIFGTAWLTSQLGLSIAIGTFIAGLVLSESDYSHQILADFMPFRDLFISLFFVSMGMLLSLSQLWAHLPLVLAVVALLIVTKFLITGGVVRVLGYPARVSVLVGLGLAQVGEFSFVLAQEGINLNLLAPADYQVFLGAAILSMAATPLLIAIAPRIAFRGTDTLRGDLKDHREALEGHVIIVGYGLSGRNLSRILRSMNIPHLAIELNASIADHARTRNEPVTFGDATRREMLLKAGIEKAKVMVLVISDPVATRHTVSLARQCNPHLQIIVRTRYVREHDDLVRLGAAQVIPEEFETSLQISHKVLQEFEVPPAEIQRVVDEVRQQGYQLFRG
jgi:CPA2 family monovalent cation:H+ antiporter-2